MAAKGLHFEIYVKFTNEPHILLAEIAQKTAKRFCIQNPGKFQRRQVTGCKENQVLSYGKDPKRRVDIEPGEKQKIPALHTTGVDFNTFWKMQDYLDVMIYIPIVFMLNAYGVEAARETIIREIKHVFDSYGISVNKQHLSLVADFMTHTGEYRPNEPNWGISESISPLSKMSYETASQFIVETAMHGEVDVIFK